MRGRRGPVSALPRADLAPGPARSLNDALHDLHHRAGWPSLRTLAAATGVSHTTVSKVFSQPALPTWGTLELLVEAMDGDGAHFHELWLAASTPTDGVGHTAPRDRRASRRARRRTPAPRERHRAPPRHRRGRHRQDHPRRGNVRVGPRLRLRRCRPLPASVDGHPADAVHRRAPGCGSRRGWTSLGRRAERLPRLRSASPGHVAPGAGRARGPRPRRPLVAPAAVLGRRRARARSCPVAARSPSCWRTCTGRTT